MDPSQTYDLLRNLTTPVVAITSARNGKLNGMISDGALRISIVPDIPHHIGATGCPILEDCYAWFDCTVINRMEAEYSTFFLGQAVDVGRGCGEEVLEPEHLREALPPEFRDRYPRSLAAAQERARSLAWLFTTAAV